MLNVRYFLVVATVIIYDNCCGVVYAQNGIMYASEMTRLPLGCRVMAMGDAAVALPFDVVGAYWNPGIPSFIHGYDIRIEGAKLYGGLSSQGALALGIPIQQGLYTAVLYSPFFPGDIREYDTLPGTSYLERQENYTEWESKGIFHDNHHLILVSLSKRYQIPLPRPAGASFPLPLDFGFGLNIKYYWHTMTPGDDVRMGMNLNIDLGFLVRFGVDYDLVRKEVSRQICLGVALRNVVPTDMVWTYSDYREPVDNSQYYGLAYIDDAGFRWMTWKVSCALHRTLTDMSKGSGNSVERYTEYENTYHYGGEIGLFGIVDIRAGISNKHPTLGAGIHYKNYAIDYAFRFDEIDYSYLRISLGFTF